MNTGRLFWGMLFLTAGILLLLDRLCVFSVTWDVVWQFWPLVLVFWGVALVLAGTRARWVAVAFAAITVAVIVAGILHFLWKDGTLWKTRTAVTQELIEPMRTPVERARLRFDSGAGSFKLTDTTAELLEASVRSTIGRYRLSRTTRDSLEDLFMELEGDSPVRIGRVKNSVKLRLNPAPLWDLDFDVGATELRMDLVPFRIRELMVDCGASSVNLTLGDRADSTRIVIDAGASSVRLRVPEHCGCRVELDAGISSKRLQEFRRVAEDVYETENYRESSRRILVILDAGVSSIRIDRYRLEGTSDQW
jgi:hypothetical protein